MKKLFVVFLWPFLFLAPLRAQQAAPPPVQSSPPIQTGGEIAARSAIEVWLALVDDGQYDKSWDTAASGVQKVVLKDQWTKVFTEHRQRLGKVLSRALKSTRSFTNLPGAPAGQYVEIQYDTSFEHKKVALEIVTSMLDESGQWKVSGYHVR